MTHSINIPYHWQGLRSRMFCQSMTRIIPSPSVSTSAWSGWSPDWTWAKMSGVDLSSRRVWCRVTTVVSLHRNNSIYTERKLNTWGRFQSKHEYYLPILWSRLNSLPSALVVFFWKFTIKRYKLNIWQWNGNPL